MRRYLRNIVIALDQLLNAILGGWADETISSRSWRWHKDGIRSWPYHVIDFIAFLLGDKDHCFNSFESERTGKYLPPELRTKDYNNYGH